MRDFRMVALALLCGTHPHLEYQHRDRNRSPTLEIQTFCATRDLWPVACGRWWYSFTDRGHLPRIHFFTSTRSSWRGDDGRDQPRDCICIAVTSTGHRDRPKLDLSSCVTTAADATSTKQLKEANGLSYFQQTSGTMNRQTRERFAPGLW
eukprot:scaffold12243_cov116-Isochrysis_galbana.AAC.3